MARFVSPERLWPLLAYFAGAVVVVLAADLIIDVMGWSRDAMLGVVVVWLVLVPIGAWLLWRRGAEGR